MSGKGAMLAALWLTACTPTLGEPTAAVDELIGTRVVVSWTQSRTAPAHVEYRFEDTVRESPTLLAKEGANEAVLLGIPYDADVTYAVVTQDDRTEDASVATAPLPEGLPVPELLASDGWDPEIQYVLTSAQEVGRGYEGRWSALIIDRAGRIVWSLQSPPDVVTIYPQVAADGTILVDHDTFWIQFDQGESSQVMRTGLDGVPLAAYDTPGLHHGFTEDPSANIVWAATGALDESLRVVTPDGVASELWSCGELRLASPFGGPCSANTLTWQPSTESFLLSFWSLETVVEIDGSSGDRVRTFGHIPGAWSFAPADSAFYWQHGATYTDAGTMLVVTRASPTLEETWVREYALDADEASLVEVWHTGEGSGLYSGAMGEAHRLSNGNTLFGLGAMPRMREVTPAGEIVWDVALPEGEMLGLTTPLSDLYGLK